MEKLLEKLGLSKEATEEEALKKLEDLQKEKSQLEADKSKLATDNQELTATVKEEKAKYETLEVAYKSLVENQPKEDSEESDDILVELADE